MSLPQPSLNNSQRGFTLIEMLVALAVLGLFGTLFSALLQGSLRVVQREHSVAQLDTSVGAAQRVLRARIETLAPVSRQDSEQLAVDARGDKRIFSFAAPAPVSGGPDALLRYRLTLTAAGDLVLYTSSSLNERIDLGDPAMIGWDPQTLLTNVNELELAYYGPDRLALEDRWQSFWADRPQPPVLVRIRLKFAPGDPRQWPDLVVHPAATASSLCRVQRGSGRCEAP